MHCVDFVKDALFESFGDISDNLCLLCFLTSSQWTEVTAVASFQEN